MVPRRKQWTSGPGRGSNSKMAKDAAQQGEVHLPAASLKDLVSGQSPSFPEPQQRQQLTETQSGLLPLISKIQIILFEHGNMVTISFYTEDLFE